jgi:RNA polymerase sigma factor (sigma-70 family)
MTAALPEWDIVTDAQLVCAAAAGDRAAFASIYDRYADPLHDFCIGMLRNREAAADCVQDAFCIAATHLPKLREPAKLRPWLYSIARNEALRCIRARKREQAVDEVPESLDFGPGPATLVRRNELADLIAAAAGGLSDRDQAVYELAYRRGLDGAELAEAMGVSASNAKKMAQRLRETVERSLGALLVSRAVRSNVNACPGLAEILDGWDGKFTVLTRKRVSRHIESCLTCDELRRQMVNPIALLGSAPLVIPAPAALRQHTLNRVHLGSPAGSGPAPQHTGSDATLAHTAIDATPSVVETAIGAAPTATPDDGGRRRRFTGRVVKGAALVAGLIAVPAVVIGLQHQGHDVPVNPAVTDSPAPPTAIGRSVGPTTTFPAVPVMAPPTESSAAPVPIVVPDPVTTPYEPPAAKTTEAPSPSAPPTNTMTTVMSTPVSAPPRSYSPTAPSQTPPAQQPSQPTGGSTGSPSPPKFVHPVGPGDTKSIGPSDGSGGGSGGLY